MAAHRFSNPWPDSAHATFSALLKWQRQRLVHGRPPLPEPFPLTAAKPEIVADTAGQCRITWLGQSGFLIQVDDVNLLTDPILSARASPFSSIGPRRLVPAPISVADLPEIHAVLLSHDHHDHFDAGTIRSLAARFGERLPFFAPLAHRALLRQLGASQVVECDWWEGASLRPDVELVCLPVQHWSRRGWRVNRRLWGSWLLRTRQRRIYFAGDSGYCPAFSEIRARVGAPDIALLPVGAYEPRWFMRNAHMNPEEAVQAFQDLGAREFVAMHWGTFWLTDEPILEPPVRLRSRWRECGLAEAQLHIPNHGETIVLHETSDS